MILVGCFGCGFQLAVRLIEQVLGVSGMATQVPLIRLLRSDDLVIGLLRQPLGRSNVRMPIRVHILCRRMLCDRHATGNQTYPKRAC